MKIRLDISTKCQLKCPVCPTAKGDLAKTPVQYGALAFDDFKVFINQHPDIREIEISSYGEVFLNKDLTKILEYAYHRNRFITIFNGANLNHATDEQLESLVKCQVRKLNVSIDGVTQETYSKYRINGKLDNVLDNIKKINACKKQYHSVYPELTWQFIAFSFNVHEIEEAKNTADSLDMSFFIKQNWDKQFYPTEVESKYQKLIASLDFNETEENRVLNKEENYICLQMWQKPQINWNGEVLGCCVNFWDTYGNAFSEGLEKVLNGIKYKNTQELLTGCKFISDSPCLKCGIFKNTSLKKYRMKYFFKSPVKFAVYSLKQLL